MPAGKVVDVVPDEDGYDFLHEDGESTYLLKSPEADAYAEQIASFRASNLYADNRYGSDDFAPPVASDAGPPGSNMSVPEPNMSAAPPPPPAPAPVAPPPPAAPLQTEGGPAAPPVPAPQPDPLGQLALQAAIRPGSPGVSQAQLQRKAGMGVEVPTSSTTTVEGAIPYDEQAAAERAAAQQMQREAHAARAEANVYAAQDEAIALQNQADAINAQIAPARKRLQEIEAGVKADETSYRQLRAKVATGEIDTGRMFRGPLGTLAAIAGIIGSALGARGASLARTPNFALQVFQSAIDRDVQAQEDDFRRLGQGADNMFRDLMAQYQDADQARAALRGMQLEQAKTIAQYTISRSKAGDAELAFQEWLANDIFEDVEGERKIREASYGKMTAKTEAAVQYPHGPTAARIDPKLAFENTLKAGTARREDALAGGTLEKQGAETVRARAEAEKATREAANGPPLNTEERKFVTVGNMLRAKIEDVVRRHGGELDPTTGEFTKNPDLPLDLPGGDTEATGGAKAALVELGQMAANFSNAGAEAGQPTKEAMTPNLGTVLNSRALGQLQQMYRGTMIAQQTFEKNRAGGSGAPAAGGQSVRLTPK